jgi:hypothetical protein
MFDRFGVVGDLGGYDKLRHRQRRLLDASLKGATPFIMSTSDLTQPTAQSSAAATGGGAASPLLLDQFLPSYDYAVVHAQVFRTPAVRCSSAASELDLFQAPLIRALIDIRALPQRVAGTLRGLGAAATPASSRRTFRFRDMVGLGWILLGETPGVEMVLGQVSRPSKGVATSARAPTTAEQFMAFGEPGFAKIAASLRTVPHGNDSSILTMETRVVLTDDESRRRFRRYWLVIGPFSSLIRRMALRLLATELRRSTPVTTNGGGLGRRDTRVSAGGSAADGRVATMRRPSAKGSPWPI